MSTDNEIRTIRDLIERMAQAQPEGTFLISAETGKTLTFRKLQERSRLFSRELLRAGLEPGDKVAFLLDNGLFTAQLFLGVMYGAFVAVPLNVRAGVSQLSYTLDHCDAKVVYVGKGYDTLIEEVIANVGRKVRVIPANVDDLPVDRETSATEVDLSAPGPEDPAMLMYTSGSTGQPKGAVHSHRTVLAHGRNSISSHQLSSSDRSLLVLPLYHINAECVTLVPTLMSGGSVVVPHRFSVSQFWDWLDEYHCTWSAVVPTIISQLLDWRDPRADSREAAFQRIRFLRSSSAPLAPSLHREFLEKFKLLLIQAMGSSEAGNVFSNPLPPGENKIGSPGVPWGFEARIVNREGVEQLPGESGEVLIRGRAVMQGYYKQPEETAAVLDGEGWLHTGDLAYRDEDGYFFVVGRSKELIIKGGVNIAPRQIDDVLESHPAVLEAASVGVPDHYLGEDVVAFVVLRAGAACVESELLTFCEGRLGHFKTPTRIYFAADLPKGPSGKVQRLRLRDEATQPAISLSPGSEFAIANGTGPVTLNGSPGATSSIELIIREIWAEALSQPNVALDSNFFALGGHSLLAVQCVSRLREKIPVALSLSDFFENATVAQQAALVRTRLSQNRSTNGTASADLSVHPFEEALQRVSSSVTPSTIPPRDRTLPCPLSPAQRRLWFMEQLNPGLPVYNEAEAVRLHGELNVDALERALNGVVARREILRTTIEVTDDEPRAVVHESWPIQLKKVDLSTLAAPERQEDVERLLIQEPRELYHLETKPGIRATLLCLGPRDHVLILMMHHIICDWSSEGVLWRELAVLYRAFSNGAAPDLPPLTIQHGDYAAWQVHQNAEANFAEDLAFWDENLRGAPQLLELPADRARPPMLSYRGARQRFVLNPALTKSLRGLSQRAQTTLFSVFAAALNTLLYRYTGQEDILLGIPIADRDRKELQQLIGFLLHTQVLRTELSPDMTFRRLLAGVQKAALDLYLHRAVPFDQVVRRIQPERNLSYSPLFQVMLNWRDRDQLLSFIGLDGLVVESLLAESRTSKFDLTLFATDCGDEIWLEMEYSTDLFDDERIARMLGHFQTLLESVADDPDRRLAELPILTPAERQQMLVEWNRTETVYPMDRLLHELVEKQVERTPDAVAVVFENRELTFRDLDEHANRLARRLQSLGVGPNVLVGVYVERSLEMLVGLLGISKAGGAYVPLDPNFPSDRLDLMLEDSQPLVLLTQENLQPRLLSRQAQIVLLDGVLAPTTLIGGRELLRDGRHPSDLAYVLYTSGSTGKPKGVEISNRALVNFLSAMQHEPGLRSGDTLLAVTTLSFDIAGLELFLPLVSGARLVIASAEAAMDGSRLSSLIARHGVTVMQATPATWLLLLETGWIGSKFLTILCGGEAWPPRLAERLLSRCKSLWNMYGPTETTIWSSATRVKAGKPVLIGFPIANTTFHVLDSRRELVPIGVPGELYIGGDGVARGYFERPDLNRERFVSDPFGPEPHARLYKTGDLVRRLPCGGIEFLQRIDQQVKIRGFRIELGDIESALNQHRGVRESVVIAREESTGQKRLVAYIVPVDERSAPATIDLRDFLKQKLPGYMIPSAFAPIEKLPLTPNGKLDRKSLPPPEHLLSQSAPARQRVTLRTSLELGLARIWEEVLGVKVASPRDNFFDLGGHSLLAAKLFAQIENVFKVKLPLAALYKAPTIEDLAKILYGEANSSDWSPLVAIQPSGSRPAFFCFHAAGGNVLNYQKLSQYMGSEQPFYGLQSQGLDGHSPLLTTIEEMATVYVRAIQGIQPRGPYLLGGYCLGGTIAYEAAQQLHAAGEQTALLALFDALNWGLIPRGTWSKSSRAVQRVFFHTMGLLSLDSDGKGKFFKGKIEALRTRIPVWGEMLLTRFNKWRSGEAAPEFLVVGRTWQTNHRAARKYVPKPYPGVVTDFRPGKQYRVFDQPGLKWDRLAEGGQQTVVLPGYPGTMLVEPFVKNLAARLTSCIDDVIAGLNVEVEEVSGVRATEEDLHAGLFALPNGQSRPALRGGVGEKG
jgi:amino acid adenylation domain-containing protein